MQTSPSPSFGALLRQYRRAAGLTQEALAERAGLGRATIDALERGTRQAPRRETVELLADALQLAEGERTLLEAAARGRRRDAQFPVTLLTPAELPPPTSPAERAAPAEAIRPPATPARGQGVTGLLTRKRSAGLISGLLVAVMLGGALFLMGEPGGHSSLRGGTLCLATNFPTTGTHALAGKLLEDAVNLAVKQNQHLGHGYRLQVINDNEASPLNGYPDPSINTQNIQQLVQNSCVVGLVGPWSSRLAARVQLPIAANAGLVMISPTNTDPCLTVRAFAEVESVNFEQLHPAGKPLNYFRVAPTDVAQVTVDASLILEQLFKQRVWVVDDGTPYGEELAHLFIVQFQARGGQLVGSESLSSDQPGLIPQVAGRMVAANPEAVFFAGGTSFGGGLLKAQLFNRGYTGAFVGGDALANDPDFVGQAGVDAANGTYASQAAPDPTALTSSAAAQFVRDYRAAYPGLTPDGYTANAYDAALVLITAIKHLIGAGQAVTREAVRDGVQHIQYTGVTGPINFDANGDIVHGVFSIYEVRNGSWVYIQQVSA